MSVKTNVRDIVLGCLLALAAAYACFLFASCAESAFAGQRQANINMAVVAADAAVSPTFSPHSGAIRTSVYVISNLANASSFKVQRCAGANLQSCTWRDVSGTTITNVANTEDTIVLDMPVTPIRVYYNNTTSDAGTWSAEFIEGGESGR